MAGIGTRKLTLTIDAVDYTAEVSKAIVKSADADSDFLTFADAAAGGSRAYTLELEFVQDATSASLWSKVWTATGTDVPVVIKPYGNASPSVSQPHFTAVATISEPDGDFLGGEADNSTTARFTVAVEWKLAEKPTKVTV
jgi:hypothetical protein